jgi:hypothetical protein
MRHLSHHRYQNFLRGGCVLVALSALPTLAHATPYAFASNQISDLTVTYSDGTALTNVTSATTNISDGALYNGYSSSGNLAGGLVGNAISIPQAYSGPDSTAPTATFTSERGSFTGTRSDAAISAGSAKTGGVNVSNVA